MDTNWIQRHALLVLMRNRSARVKDLSPPDMPASLFSYHLDSLRSAGYIQKSARGVYQLTTQGEAFAGTFSTETLKSVKEIKTVIMFYGKRNDNYLLFKWSRQPYLGQITLPYDRLSFEYSLEEGLQKAMSDKLGIITETKYKTSIMIKVIHDGITISHMNALIYVVDVDTIPLPLESRNGRLTLQKLKDIEHIVGLDELINSIEHLEPITEIVLTY